MKCSCCDKYKNTNQECNSFQTSILLNCTLATICYWYKEGVSVGWVSFFVFNGKWMFSYKVPALTFIPACKYETCTVLIKFIVAMKPDSCRQQNQLSVFNPPAVGNKINFQNGTPQPWRINSASRTAHHSLNREKFSSPFTSPIIIGVSCKKPGLYLYHLYSPGLLLSAWFGENLQILFY